jgi:hypothetical protein
MATSFFDPLLQLFDSLGELAVGAKVFSYEAGTTTPLATYQDLAGAIPNTNPAVADAAGRPVIRLTDGVAYKLIVKNSAETETYFTRDNVVVGQVDAGSPYYVHTQFLGDAPEAQQVVCKHVFGVAVSFEADLPNAAYFDVGTLPTGDCVFNMANNGTVYGTLTIDTAGAVSADCDAQDFGLGDVFELITPDDGTDLADIAGTINGTVS